MTDAAANAQGQTQALPSVSQFRLVVPFVRPHAGRLVIVFLLTLLSTLMGLAYPLGAKFLVDNALMARNQRVLVIASAVLAALVVLGFVLGALTRYLYTQVSARVLMDMRLYLFRHLQSLSPRFFARTRTGDILSRLSSDLAEIQSISTDAVFSLALSLLTLVGTVGLLIYLDWRLFLLCTFFLPLGARFLVRHRQRIAAQARTVRERNADVSSTLLESLQGMKWIKTVGAEDQEADKLKGRNDSYFASLLKYQVVSAYANAMPALILGASTLVLLLYGGHRVITGEMTLGALVAFAAYQARVLGPLQSIIGLYLSVQRARVALDRVLEFLHLKPEVEESVDAVALQKVRGEIELCSVSFAYQAGEPVIRHVNLRIEPGSRVAIVGPSGSGKSTLVDLVLRFYDPQEGRILFDGRDLRDLQIANLRSAMAVISAEPFLFHASIEENLRAANPAASAEQLWKALRIADLGCFVQELPQGLNTLVGERGIALSTGQRQRLAIARAVLRDAQVWIFDEATGSLDVLTEAKIWGALEEWLTHRTTLIISHRLSCVRGADWTVVLDRGEVSQQGPHAHLVQEEGVYRQLYLASEAGKSETITQELTA